MAVFTQVVGAAIGIGAVFAVVIAPDLKVGEPVHVTCTDAMLIPRPETDATEIYLTCRTESNEPVQIEVPVIPGQ